MPNSRIDGLTEDQVETFITEGALRLDDAFPAALAAECRRQLWAETGLDPDRPDTWTAPVIRIPAMATEAFVEAANTPRLHRAWDQLAGEGRWIAPQGIGTIPIRFPATEAPNDIGWHIDASFGDSADFMDWRANVTSRGRALLMLFLFSDVGPEDAPTRIRQGSHQRIARALLPFGRDGATLRQLSADGWASTGDFPEALATGPAGSVWLCHPFLVHSAQIHRGEAPRFMAQPPLVPAGEFDPDLPPSPVQIAIRRGCGLGG